MTTGDPSGRKKLGLPASSLMPSFATTTPVPVAMELASSGAFGFPFEAWTSASASPSCRGLPGPAGLNGQVLGDGLLWWATFAPAGTAGGVDAATWICGSGMTSETAGLLRSAVTSEADSVAATELGSASCVTPVPPLDLMRD